MVGVDMRLKDFFFDRAAIDFALTRAEIKTLSKIGGFLRKRSRSSLRRRKRPSTPGNPPSVHSTDNVTTLKNILFGYEPNTHGVVVGPVRLNHKQSLNGVRTNGTIPELHEFGGTAGIREWYSNLRRKWVPGALRRSSSRAKFRQRVRRAKYPPRPTMGPALDAEVKAGTIPNAWKGQVTA